MFTGLVQRVGVLKRLARAGEGWSLTLTHAPWPDALVTGESVAVQGACLTVTSVGDGVFTADLLDETLRRTALREMGGGARVNLERALEAGGRLGGHFVQGHVDGTGRILSRTPGEQWEVVEISCPAEVQRYLVEKGSVTVDGVSLTVFDIRPDRFTVSLIPTTLELTTLGPAAVGAVVNLEADILGKYIVAHLERLELGALRETTHA